MSGPIRTRLACDRCHSQKLRCPKQPGSALCTRCLKAGASCVYSPPGTIVSLGNGNSVGMTGSAMMMMGRLSRDSTPSAEAFDWGAYDAMDFNTLLPQPSPEEPRPCQDGSTNLATVQNGIKNPASSDAPPDDEQDNSRPACTKRLTDLLLNTDKLWARLPLKSTLHMPRGDPHELYLKALTEKATAKYLLENLFILTQQLIDLYPPATALILPRDADSPTACDVPDCTHELALPSSLRELEGQTSGRGRDARVDAALANLLVACHLRLLDVLDRVFLLVSSCTRVTLASPDRRGDTEFDVADVRVGSFVPHRTAAVLMQIVLLRHLMVSLSDRLASLGEAVVARAAAVGGGGEGSGSGPVGGDLDLDLEARVLKLQHESLARRHARQIEYLGSIEEFLAKFDMNKI